MPPPRETSQSTAVVIAAYQAELTLERALASALAQPETAEVCVVDDASEDKTAMIAEKVAQSDPRVRVLRQAVNEGPAAARNRAIAATSSPWLAILDADDFMVEGRLERLHGIAGDADFVADALTRMKPERALSWSPGPLEPRSLSFVDFVAGNTGRAGGELHLGFLKPLMRRDFLDAWQLRYQRMRLGEDYEFYARALLHGARFLVCEEAGYISLERPGSLSRKHSEHDLRLLRDCDDDLQRLRRLSAAERDALRRHRTSVDCRYQWRRMISAVKAGDVTAALSTFTSPVVASYLLGALLAEAWRRSTGRGPHDLHAETRSGASRPTDIGLKERRG